MIKLDDETKKKVEELRSKAVEEYFETCDSIVPGFLAFITRKDIHLAHYHVTMHPGIFFVNIETINDPEEKDINVYYFSNLELPKNEPGEEEAQGRFELTAIQGKLFRNKKKQTIGLTQIQLYATADYLREHESEEEARKFLDTVFSFKPVDKEQGFGEVVPTKLYTNKLDEKHHAYDFMTKCFRGVEEIAKGNFPDGVYSFQARNNVFSTSGVFVTNPETCKRFMATKNANALILELIRQTVIDLLRKPEAYGFATPDGRIWLTTATILKELSRTKQGINQYIHQNENAVQLVNNALFVLMDSTLESRDAYDETKYKEILLPIHSYAREFKHNGVTYKHVWGFYIASINDEHALTMLKNSATLPLLNHAPFGANELWVTQFLSGELIPRAKNRLKKSKKKQREATIKESWSSIFLKAEPMKDKLNSNVQERITKSIQEALRATAIEEANRAQKPVFIKAKTTRKKDGKGRGRGSLQNLELTVTEKPIEDYEEHINEYVDLV